MSGNTSKCYSKVYSSPIVLASVGFPNRAGIGMQLGADMLLRQLCTASSLSRSRASCVDLLVLPHADSCRILSRNISSRDAYLHRMTPGTSGLQMSSRSHVP